MVFPIYTWIVLSGPSITDQLKNHIMARFSIILFGIALLTICGAIKRTELVAEEGKVALPGKKKGTIMYKNYSSGPQSDNYKSATDVVKVNELATPNDEKNSSKNPSYSQKPASKYTSQSSPRYSENTEKKDETSDMSSVNAASSTSACVTTLIATAALSAALILC